MEGSSESDSDGEEEELVRMYRDACAKKGIKVASKKLGESTGVQPRGTRSAKVELFRRDEGAHQQLPPITFPSMHPHEKPINNYLEMSAEQKYQIR